MPYNDDLSDDEVVVSPRRSGGGRRGPRPESGEVIVTHAQFEDVARPWQTRQMSR